MSNIIVDDTAVKEMLEALATKKILGIEKKALRKAANELRKTSRANLRKELPKANKKGKYNDTLIDGVRSSVYEVTEGMEAKVHIMGKRSSGSGTFRTRFFEGGTVVRKTKAGKNRGKLKALDFFNSAVASTKGKVTDTLDAELSKSIQAIADKKYGR